MSDKNIPLNIKKTTTRNMPEYRNWHNMKNRCLNQNIPEYKWYGARGIRVCDRWLNSFENFLADMGTRPSPKHSIDRIDNNGNYCPENCRWATQKQQSRNTRNNRKITINGICKTVAEWAEIVGMKQNSLLYRIRRGTPPEDAINPDLKPKHTRKKLQRLVKCIVCDGDFIPRPNQLRLGHGKFCSQKCNFASRNKDKFGRIT